MVKKNVVKKVCLFIVEGSNDEVALGKPLENLQKSHSTNNMILIGITHGDITSNYAVKNVKHEIANHVKKFCNDNKLTKSDICEVVLLIDMDGTYIPDDAILASSEHTKAFYSENSILHTNPKAIQKSHKVKKEHINTLLEMKNVWGNIPFNIYFVSCNLDHIICRNANLSNKEKNNSADDFSFTYGEDSDGFIAFFNDNEIILSTDYNESWISISEGMNSLNRYSNMNIFINRLV